MNTDKAYLLGLIIGGGVFGNAEDVFRIKLPYNKWGSYIDNPQRAGQIAGDILNKVGQMFRAIYNLTIQYEASPSGTWIILCEGDTTAVKEDLSHYGIICEGELRGVASIRAIIPDLIDDNLKRRFVAGLADTIGSMAKSQRRFTDEHQILSFEIKGYNFDFVCDLCRLLYSINCIPDQINWNHPNIHCPSNPYYAQWNKGFKLRILLDQYSRFGAFAFRTKAETSNENRRLQRQSHTAEKCEERDIHVNPSTVHPAENDERLPEKIKGGHYIHFRHFCTVLGCDHAPYGKIRSCISHIGELINPFPILCKDSLLNINVIVESNDLLSTREYEISNINVSAFQSLYDSDRSKLLYGDRIDNGYPISEIMKAISFVVANDDELNGNRPRGSYLDIISKHLARYHDLQVEIRKPDLLTPLIISANNRAALVGAVNPSVYQTLVSQCPDNEYKLIIRPITEEDLRNA